jgi:hypothetical protein
MSRVRSVVIVIVASLGALALLLSKKRSPTEGPMNTQSPDTSANGYRQAVVSYARTQLDITDPSPYWLKVYGSVPKPLKKYAWCGVFVLWVLHVVGLTKRRWVSGLGFLYVDDQGHGNETPWLPITQHPEPGDVAYFDQPYQHYALVDYVDSDTVHLIAGNTPDVSAYPKPLRSATAYFSIAPLVANPMGQG